MRSLLFLFLLSVPLIQASEPFIPASEYQARRQALIEKRPDHPMVFMGNVMHTRINSTQFEFRQESSFLYLTGLNEPDAFLILSKKPFKWKGEQVQELLFVKGNSRYSLIWEGKKLGVDEAKNELGFQAVAQTRVVENGRTIDQFEAFLADLVKAYPTFYLHTPIIHADRFGKKESYNALYKNAILEMLQPNDLDADGNREGKLNILDTMGLQRSLATLRSVKSQAEIDILKKAVEITLNGHEEAWRATPHVHHEYQVEAALEYSFKMQGAEAVGYNSIVGCGANGTILHYMDNRDGITRDGIFVLDAGAEYRGYTADITRSYPADGTYSKEQAEIYDIVLAGQAAGAKVFLPGNTRFDVQVAIHNAMRVGLTKIGLASDTVRNLNAKELKSGAVYTLAEDVTFAADEKHRAGERIYGQILTRMEKAGVKTLPVYDDSMLSKLFPHGWGHPIGLDVHDPWTSTPFEPGMIWTIEPGLYFNPYVELEVPAKYMNIGVRIEDMYLITETGNVCLSEGLTRDRAEIERMMAKKSTILPSTND